MEKNIKITDNLIVKHHIQPGKNQYGKKYNIYIFQCVGGDNELIWSTTTTKELKVGKEYRLTYSISYFEDENRYSEYISNVDFAK